MRSKFIGFLTCSVFVLVFLTLLYTRFVNLGWGLPYPFNPDERNMADAIVKLNCTDPNPHRCFNPDFFAYGQPPLYAAYGLVKSFYFLKNVSQPILYQDAVIALRLISAGASVIAVWVLVKILFLIFQSDKAFHRVGKNFWLFVAFILLLLVFSPFFIQFAHFGTTESLLMLFYALIVYFSIKLVLDKISMSGFLLISSFVVGVSLSVKVSSLLFVALPLFAIAHHIVHYGPQPILETGQSGNLYRQMVHIFRNIIRFIIFHLQSGTMFKFIFFSVRLSVFSLLIAILFSPHNIISLDQFIHSMQYESEVGLGGLRVFYTRQFEYTIPITFQIIKVFPYALGWPVFILAIAGFIFLPWTRPLQTIRLAILLYFIPQAYIYAKWTRFSAPIFPLLLLFAILILSYLYVGLSHFIDKNRSIFLKKVMVWRLAYIMLFIHAGIAMIPGIAYLSIYHSPDVRFTASEWMVKQMPPNSYILSETANTIDLPVFPPDSTQQQVMFRNIPFNFYEIGNDHGLDTELPFHIQQAEYIMVPSRRIFANHTCLYPSETSFDITYAKPRCDELKVKYPMVNDYYERLFNGELGYTKIAEFSSYPKIAFGNWLTFEFPDEHAEETWTVFDHPVIRVYKKLGNR